MPGAGPGADGVAARLTAEVSAELVAEEEQRLTGEIESLRGEAEADRQQTAEHDELARKFEQVAAVLQSLDLDRVWKEASDTERRVLIDELLDQVAVYPDHLKVTVHGAPRLNVTLEEVGLARPWEISGVGGGT